MAMRKVSIGATMAIALTGLFLTMITAGLITTSKTLTSTGSITALNVGIYSDSGCTQNATSIDWGMIAPGNSTIRTLYVKNIGTIPIILKMTTSTWVPSTATQYLSLGWDKENYVLNPNLSVMATLTLTASSSAGNLTSFSFNIIIGGTDT